MVKLNGETIAGMALAGLALIFIYAGSVNNVWRVIIPADLILLGVGAALIALGVVTMKRSSTVHTESHTERRSRY